MTPNWIFLGALLGAVSVIAGAFGAHGLASRLDARSLELWTGRDAPVEVMMAAAQEARAATS